LVAAADATGKWLAATPSFNRIASEHLTGDAAASLRSAARPSGNFEIFRTASRHLFSGEDLYAEYPAEHVDRFKYSPTFALLFAPFAYLFWPLALFLWNALNALVVFYAIEKVLEPKKAIIAQGWMLLELLRGMQNAQSNAVVAGLIILSFAAMEQRHAWRSAGAVILGAVVKIFPLAALSFAVPRRQVIRTGIAALALGVVALLLPLLVTSPSTLMMQYESWRAVEAADSLQRWFSVMALLYRLGIDAPNWSVQLAGILAVLAPIFVRRERWNEVRFRILYLCSVLLFVVLFNHQAERASYLIAFLGATLWFAHEPSSAVKDGLYGIAFLTMPLMSTLIPGRLWRDPDVMLFRLAVPGLLIWLVIQRELWRSSSAVADVSDSATPSG
jgi:hypothetical protein